MIKRIIYILIFSLSIANAQEDKTRTKELDAYWTEVSVAVKKGDYDGYAATCHPEGVLVSESKKKSYPLTTALAGWKPGFNATKSGKVKASVEFRFSQRLGDATTAHETGMFRYSSTDEKGVTKTVYVHLEAMLVKKRRWLILMEYQKSAGTAEEWEKLK